MYMVTVSGRFPENSEILKMSIPHLLTSSNSCGSTTGADVRRNMPPRLNDDHEDAGGKEKETKKQSKVASYFSEQPLLAGVDPEARDGGRGQTGAVGGLLHAADLGHGPLLFVLFLGGGRHDVHVMLLLCQIRRDGMLPLRFARCERKVECSTLLSAHVIKMQHRHV